MNKLFILQLITSFIAGGAVVSLLSLISEKVDKKLAGIIIAFPSTGPLGLFFLGWTSSAEEVAKIIPSVLIPLGLTTIYPVIYAYIAEMISNSANKKANQIIMTFIISSTIWLALAFPFAYWKFSDLTLGTLGFSLLAAGAGFFLHRKKYDKPIALKYTTGQKIARAAFAGVLISLVVLQGKILSPVWGGVFAMFPAAFSSTLMIINWYYGPNALFPYFQKTAIGSVSIFIYCITVMLSFPVLGFIWGTLTAYGISSIVTLTLFLIQKIK